MNQKKLTKTKKNGKHEEKEKDHKLPLPTECE